MRQTVAVKRLLLLPLLAAVAACSGKPAEVFLPGLQASYFDDLKLTGDVFEFAGKEVKQIDAKIDFDWGIDAPTANIDGESFGVRWVGFVTVPKTDDYKFVTTSDDGVRLFINSNKVLENWTQHSATKDESSVVRLEAGARYPITMEFFENTGAAVAKLGWKSAAIEEQIVPAGNLSYKQ
jgi:hypothetical protein